MYTLKGDHANRNDPEELPGFRRIRNGRAEAWLIGAHKVPAVRSCLDSTRLASRSRQLSHALHAAVIARPIMNAQEIRTW